MNRKTVLQHMSFRAKSKSYCSDHLFHMFSDSESKTFSADLIEMNLILLNRFIEQNFIKVNREKMNQN